MSHKQRRKFFAQIAQFLKKKGIQSKTVKSSNIQSISYKPEEKELYVGFKTGSLYKYKDVPSARHKAFMNAESHGKFFHKKIKGKFDFVKVK